jgi:hypothetical protein
MTYLGKRLAGEIAQDKTYPNMWRVRLPDGHLSDMVNLTRAKDACTAMAATHERKGRHSPSEAPQTRHLPPPLPTEITAPSSAL